jgi:hypothetical protein
LAVINADMQNESFYKAARRKLEWMNATYL